MCPRNDTNGTELCSLAGWDPLTPYLAATHAIIAVCSIIGNSLVLIAVWKFESLRTSTNTFVVGLAAADLLVGLNIPFYISFYFDVSYLCDPVACLCRYFFALFATISSLLLLVGVAADRYVSILHPLRYPTIMTTRVAGVTVVGIYLYVIILSTMPLGVGEVQKNLNGMSECDLYYVVQPWYALSIVGVHVTITIVITTYLYCKIFWVAWCQNRALALSLHADLIRREAKVALVMVSILGVTLFCHVPYLIVIMMRYFVKESLQMELSEAKKITVVLYLGKSAINPIIYGWKNRDFRDSFDRLLQRSATTRRSFSVTANSFREA